LWPGTDKWIWKFVSSLKQHTTVYAEIYIHNISFQDNRRFSAKNGGKR
jgi:hypothetical protein